jgi:hypothetical protein
MDCMTSRELLVQSGHDIAFFELLVARQLEALANLERRGQDATQVRQRLAQLEGAQKRHCEHRARLLMELAQAAILVSAVGSTGSLDMPAGRECPLVPAAAGAFHT